MNRALEGLTWRAPTRPDAAWHEAVNYCYFTQPKNTGLNEQNFFTADVRPAEFAEFGLDPVELFSEPATDFRAQFGRKILCKGPPTAGGFGNANRGPG